MVLGGRAKNDEAAGGVDGEATNGGAAENSERGRGK